MESLFHLKNSIILTLALLSTSCVSQDNTIDTMIADYPHGERRIMVQRSGEAYLSYGSRPQSQIIKPNIFSIDKLHSQLRDYFHENMPREQWPDPKSQCGMVTLRFSDGSQTDFLIFDIPEIMEEIFNTAEQNVFGERF